jgi:hypothetical protein
VILAEGNQWEHCYSATGATPDACSVGAIGDRDTNNTVGALDKIDVQNPQANQSTGAVRIDRVEPTAAVSGGLVHIFGSGFDAVSGHSGGVGGACRGLHQGNSCNPLHGTCVEFRVDDRWEEAQGILAVTPTHLVVRAPISCAAPIMLRVRRTILNGSEVASDPVPFCYNIPGTPSMSSDGH